MVGGDGRKKAVYSCAGQRRRTTRSIQHRDTLIVAHPQPTFRVPPKTQKNTEFARSSSLAARPPEERPRTVEEDDPPPARVQNRDLTGWRER